MNNYSTHIDLYLYSQFTKTVPLAEVWFDDYNVWQGPVNKATTVSFDTLPRPAGNYWMRVLFKNKDDSGQQHYGKDIMLGIRSVQVQNYDHEFSIYSEYEPEYPTIWYQQQKELNQTPPKVILSNYLGWPGEWRLQIGLPIYRWIHVTTNQGWLI
jgi:hypothetical protein